MEARFFRAALVATLAIVSMGAQYRTPNFVIETQDPAFAQQMGQAAEKFRRELAIEWLGEAMPNWSRPCPITVQAGANLGAGGATTFMFDGGEVFGWRMTIQGSRQRLLDSVLPHEITHMIFASHFRCPLPRWADEGGATSVEHVAERTKHRQMLRQFLSSGRGIAFNRMFAMKEYPRDVMPLYAQGYSVVQFLIQQGGRRKFVTFLEDGLRDDQWAAAIQRHYGLSGLSGLQHEWLAWVKQGSPIESPQPSHPAATPDVEQFVSNDRSRRTEPIYPTQPVAEQLASRGTPSRPASNLIHGVDDKRENPSSYAPGSVLASPEGKISSTGFVLVDQNSRPQPKSLPSDGWRPVGARPAPAAAVAATPATQVYPASSHVTRPQPFEPSRQIILEWTGDRTR